MSDWVSVDTDCLHIGFCHLRVQAGISSWRFEDAKYKIGCPKEGLKVIVHILQRGEKVMMKIELNLDVWLLSLNWKVPSSGWMLTELCMKLCSIRDVIA